MAEHRLDDEEELALRLHVWYGGYHDPLFHRYLGTTHPIGDMFKTRIDSTYPAVKPLLANTSTP